MFRTSRFVPILLVMTWVLLGCGPKRNECEVSGTVTIDGQPIETGTILFSAVDGATHVGGGRIENGKYSALAPPGEKIVKISGYKTAGQIERRDDLTGEVLTEDNIQRCTPTVYEFDSPLRATVEKSGEVHDFELLSDPQE